MPQLYLHNRRVKTIFGLLGEQENDASYSIAWAFARSPKILAEFITHTVGQDVQTETASIRLQQYEHNGGMTDIEINAPGIFHIIIEAKRGWTLPTEEQLKKYAFRESFLKCKATKRLLVTLTECTLEYSSHYLSIHEINGVPIKPVSWRDLIKMGQAAYRKATYPEKHLLSELLLYLGGFMTVRRYIEQGERGPRKFGQGDKW
jgi:hypothetical protein